MTQAAFPLPEWPLAERWVVSYSDGAGRVHATRHLASCAMLRTVRQALDHDPSRLRPDYYNYTVLEEPRYQRQVDLGNMPAPRDHVCVKGHEAATPSFRSVQGGK